MIEKKEFDIPTREDFDISSNMWRQNKRYIGNGYFIYTCNYIHTKNNMIENNMIENNMIENNMIEKKEFDIPTREDFDISSNMWRQNKRYIGNGYFIYTCNYIHTKNNKKCNKIIYNINYKRYYTTLIEENHHYHKNGNKYCKRHLNSETSKPKSF